MTAIFDVNLQVVGWIDERGYIFSNSLEWIAFIENSYVFSRNCVWLGGMYRGTIVDKLGKPLAWLSEVTPESTLRLLKPLTPLKPLSPLKPLRPLTPLTPLRPLRPIGGWSSLTWIQFINQ